MTLLAPSILYADADEEACFVLPRFLERCGVVRRAQTLAEARALAQAEPPAVLVVDPSLPDGDGTALIAEVHARQPWVQTLVVCGSGAAQRTSLFIAAGANDVAVKPFDVGLLPARVTRLARAAVAAHREAGYRQRLEERLHHAERIATLGTLCATIVHEVNNPLSGILANATYLGEALRRDDVDAGEKQARLDACGDIESAARLIATFIARIRAFSRRDQEERVHAPLSQALDTALMLLRPRTLSGRVTLTVPAGPGQPVPHFPVRMVQALLNVLTNAIDAVGPGGSVSVRHVVEPDAVGLEVEDDGPGIPEDLRQRVFDPFFTTKTHGTGLGLMVVTDVMTEHGGRFVLADRKGARGACARLMLPRPG